MYINWPFDINYPNYQPLHAMSEADRKIMLQKRAMFWFKKL